MHLTIVERFRRVIELDVRSLALLRIALGALLLADLAIRVADFSAMYAPEGFAPVGLVRGLEPHPWWSLYLASGDAAFQAGLFLIAAVLAGMLMIGWRTRLATVGCWLLLASLHGRLPVVNNAGDTLLRMLLFWGMFLPLGRAWSVDWRAKAIKTPMDVPHASASSATFAYILQLAIVYWAAGWAKWNDAWLAGDGVHDAMSFGLYSLPLGQWLAEQRALTRALSVGTVWLELVAPCLLFAPLGTTPLRLVLIATFIAFHIGIAATVTVGLFSYVAVAAWLALLPGAFWDRLGVGVAVGVAPKPSAGSRDVLSLYRDASGRPFVWRRSAAALLVWTSLAAVATWNLWQAAADSLPDRLRSWTRSYVNTVMLRQAWSLFGQPPRERIWFVYEARLNDGRRLDLLSRRPGVDQPCPELPALDFANHRWRKLHWRLRFDAGRPYRQPLAEYMARQWNAAHGPNEQIAELKLYCCREPLAGAAVGAQSRELLAQVAAPGTGGNFANAVLSPGEF
ncbi:MAG: hypothetical protein DCC67_14255 [Planctomycetota bacterium]|nr:MAG: hypothetical protein DCC67_14255 [Planctomycetota bacterium]